MLAEAMRQRDTLAKELLEERQFNKQICPRIDLAIANNKQMLINQVVLTFF